MENRTGFLQVVEMTDEEKFKMYMKLTKAEIVRMHIELEKYIPQRGIVITQAPNMVWPPVDNRPTFATTSSQSSLRPKYTLYLKRK